jgi:hypothetical protein
VKPSPKAEIVFTPEGKAKLVDGDLVALVPLHVAFELCKTDSGCKTNWPLGNGVRHIWCWIRVWHGHRDFVWQVNRQQRCRQLRTSSWARLWSGLCQLER